MSYLVRMEKQEVEPVIEKMSAEIANFIVGFVLIRVHDGIEAAYPAGSGTLVTIGSVGGVLTAAHVLRNLPDHSEIGILRFNKASSLFQKLTIDMEHAEKLTIAADVFGPEGPDLGFLRLSPRDVGTLNARNVFFNLGRRQASILEGEQLDLPYFDGISGMIAEWTTNLPSKKGLARVKGFESLYGVGRVVKEHEANGFDLFDFEVSYESEFVAPGSYKGMSGGALWRAYYTEGDDAQLSVSDKMLFGVAFHQSDISDRKRIITCHGPRSVYGPLIEAIRDKWPE